MSRNWAFYFVFLLLDILPVRWSCEGLRRFELEHDGVSTLPFREVSEIEREINVLTKENNRETQL